jgi:4-hydroxybenzoate polyprenyltransferase
MFVLIVYRISKIKRIPLFEELAPSIIFFSLYVVGAGSYEGNMGTAFRHKSLILWVVLLLLFAFFWRGQDEEKESRGNNSQESAV